VTSLNVTDTALILLNTQYGVEVGTNNHFRYTEKFNKPVIFVTNHLDQEKADFEKTLEQLKENFGNKIVQIQYPITTGPQFNAVVDILKMKMYRWKPEGGVPDVLEIPADQKLKKHKIFIIF
jgi:elongation factor G